MCRLNVVGGKRNTWTSLCSFLRFWPRLRTNIEGCQKFGHDNATLPTPAPCRDCCTALNRTYSCWWRRYTHTNSWLLANFHKNFFARNHSTFFLKSFVQPSARPISCSTNPSFLVFVLSLLACPPGASTAGERGAAADSVCRREGGGHRLPGARGDAVLEGAADALRGLSGADHHGDGQAQVLRHGAGSDHVDGLGHLSDRDRGEAQVSACRIFARLCSPVINAARWRRYKLTRCDRRQCEQVWCLCRDVSSVEVLMNYHQSLKSEVEARSRGTLECIEMGKTLLAVRNPAAEEVRSDILSGHRKYFTGASCLERNGISSVKNIFAHSFFCPTCLSHIRNEETFSLNCLRLILIMWLLLWPDVPQTAQHHHQWHRFAILLWAKVKSKISTSK